MERKDTLYVIDQGVLTAFDLATGNARWRLPSIGIMGLFFDDEGMIYLNTTTASPDSLKYSNQIDVTRKNAYLVMKLDPKAGKVAVDRGCGRAGELRIGQVHLLRALVSRRR